MLPDTTMTLSTTASAAPKDITKLRWKDEQFSEFNTEFPLIKILDKGVAAENGDSVYNYYDELAQTKFLNNNYYYYVK